MSKKHNQRTRAEILAKRAQPIIEIPVHRMIGPVVGPVVPFQRVVSRSKYEPHIGAKEQERAKRLYLSHDLNQQFVDRMLERRLILADELCHLRAAPTLCQMSKRQYVEATERPLAA